MNGQKLIQEYKWLIDQLRERHARVDVELRDYGHELSLICTSANNELQAWIRVRAAA